MRRRPWGRGVWLWMSRARLEHWRAIGWDGCPNWSHNLTWRNA